MLTLTPHKMKQDGTGLEYCVKRDPYIRISKATQYTNANNKVCYAKVPAIFMQGGRYYTEDGKSFAELPEWAPAEIAKISAGALAEAGFTQGPKKTKMGRPPVSHLSEAEVAKDG